MSSKVTRCPKEDTSMISTSVVWRLHRSSVVHHVGESFDAKTDWSPETKEQS
jgi:hypothetical protein